MYSYWIELELISLGIFFLTETHYHWPYLTTFLETKRDVFWIIIVSKKVSPRLVITNLTNTHIRHKISTFYSDGSMFLCVFLFCFSAKYNGTVYHIISLIYINILYGLKSYSVKAINHTGNCNIDINLALFPRNSLCMAKHSPPLI